jgi:hypothetical protein
MLLDAQVSVKFSSVKTAASCLALVPWTYRRRAIAQVWLSSPGCSWHSKSGNKQFPDLGTLMRLQLGSKHDKHMVDTLLIIKHGDIYNGDEQIMI